MDVSGVGAVAVVAAIALAVVGMALFVAGHSTLGLILAVLGVLGFLAANLFVPREDD